MDDKNKTTNQVAAISDDTLAKLNSFNEDIRASGVIDLFEQNLPQIPKDYWLKQRDGQFVNHSFQAAFDLLGGVPGLIKWGYENPTEFYKLFVRVNGETEKQPQGPAVVQVFHGVPQSPLDGFADIVDDDDEDEEQ